MYKNSIGLFSGRRAVVEAQEPAEAFAANERPGPVMVGGRRMRWLPAPRGSLLVVVEEVVADRGEQMAFAEEDELAEALATCRRALLNSPPNHG
jgi:hypothetical protein